MTSPKGKFSSLFRTELFRINASKIRLSLHKFHPFNIYLVSLLYNWHRIEFGQNQTRIDHLSVCVDGSSKQPISIREVLICSYKIIEIQIQQRKVKPDSLTDSNFELNSYWKVGR